MPWRQRCRKSKKHHSRALRRHAQLALLELSMSRLGAKLRRKRYS